MSVALHFALLYNKDMRETKNKTIKLTTKQIEIITLALESVQSYYEYDAENEDEDEYAEYAELIELLNK